MVPEVPSNSEDPPAEPGALKRKAPSTPDARDRAPALYSRPSSPSESTAAAVAARRAAQPAPASHRGCR